MNFNNNRISYLNFYMYNLLTCCILEYYAKKFM